MSTLLHCRRFIEDRRGAALIEFAFVVPILVLVLMGCFEATRYVLLHQKLDRAASSTADLVARQNGITEAQLSDLFDAAARLMEPYDLGANGRIIVTSVYRPEDDDPASVVWQRLSTGGISAASEIGDVDDAAVMPPGFVVRTGDNVIVAEVFYDYTPFFLNTAFAAAQLYHNAYNRPRESDLTQITP